MVDYLLDSNNDLKIVDGNFVRGDSTLQNQNLLLITNKGAWKQYPLVGVGLMSFLKDDDQTSMMREIRLQFSMDGMDVQTLSYQNGIIKVVAPYAN